jgi:hypothetical protein
MKAKEMSEEVYDELIRLDYHRKVNSVYEVNTSVDFSSFDKETQKVINTFPVLIFNSEIDLMDIENLDREQQFHILVIGNQEYLVDTQGYNYPRYILKLENFDYGVEDDIYERMEGLVRIADSKIFDEVTKSLAYELNKEDFDHEDIVNYLFMKVQLALGSHR